MFDNKNNYWENAFPLNQCGVLALWCSPDGVLFCSTTCGIYISSDNAKTWTKRDQGLTNGNYLYAFTGTSQTYIFGGGWGVSRTTNLGTSWEEILQPHFGEVHALYFDSKNNILYAGTDNRGGFGDAGMYKSTDFGRTFKTIINGINSPIGKVFCITPIGEKKILLGTMSGNYVTSDEGENWNRVTDTAGDYFLSISAISDKNIFSGGNFFYSSSDEGTTWKLLGKNQVQGIAALLVVPTGQAFAGTSAGIYFSKDFGKSWSRMTDGIPSGAYVKHLMRDSSNYVYAGIYAGSLFRSRKPVN